MARDFIKITRTNPTVATQAHLLKSYVDLLTQTYNLGKQIQGIMNRNHDGVVFTDIETLFGVPSGSGQAVFDLMNGSVGSMEGLFLVDDSREITQRLG